MNIIQSFVSLYRIADYLDEEEVSSRVTSLPSAFASAEDSHGHDQDPHISEVLEGTNSTRLNAL